jgi:hypothetical protein
MKIMNFEWALNIVISNERLISLIKKKKKKKKLWALNLK